MSILGSENLIHAKNEFGLNLNVFFNYQDIDNAKLIYENILEDEKSNGMPTDIIEKGKKNFQERLSIEL